MVYAAFIYRGQLAEQANVRKTQIATQRPQMSLTGLGLYHSVKGAYFISQTWKNSGPISTKNMEIRWAWDETLPSNSEFTNGREHVLHYPIAPSGEATDYFPIDKDELDRIAGGEKIYIWSTIKFHDNYPGNGSIFHIVETCIEVSNVRKTAPSYEGFMVVGCSGGKTHNCFDEECVEEYRILNPPKPTPWWKRWE